MRKIFTVLKELEDSGLEGFIAIMMLMFAVALLFCMIKSLLNQ